MQGMSITRQKKNTFPDPVTSLLSSYITYVVVIFSSL